MTPRDPVPDLRRGALGAEGAEQFDQRVAAARYLAAFSRCPVLSAILQD